MVSTHGFVVPLAMFIYSTMQQLLLSQQRKPPFLMVLHLSHTPPQSSPQWIQDVQHESVSLLELLVKTTTHLLQSNMMIMLHFASFLCQTTLFLHKAIIMQKQL